MTNIIKKDKAFPATFGAVVDQLFHNNLDRFFDDDFWGFDGSVSRSPVPVNIRETDKSFELKFVAPGLSKQQFNLQIANDLLTVSFGHKQEENGQEASAANANTGWLRREYLRQSFTRSFHLDDTVNVENVSARYDNGVLYVSLPKKEQPQQLSRTIEVN
jgi:HSP20 family protein